MQALKATIYVVCGPTAVGKSPYAVDLAEELGGEILCMDAFQVYRDMPLLSAAPERSYLEAIPHHLFGILDPLESFSLAQYYKAACEKALDLLSNSIVPIFVGGAGLYLKTLVDGFEGSHAPVHEEFRKELRVRSSEEGSLKLHEELKAVDPEAARRIHPNDEKRLIRALEISKFSTGQKQRVDLLAKICPSWEKLFLNLERQELYNRIGTRVDRMIHDGVEQEIHALLDRGLSPVHTAYHAIGIKETVSYIQGQVDRKEWIETFKRNSCRFSKRQLTWVRSMKDLQSIPAQPVLPE